MTRATGRARPDGRPVTDPAPAPENPAPKEPAMTVLAPAADPARTAPSHGAPPRRPGRATRTHGRTSAQVAAAGPRVRATPAPGRGDLLEADPVPVVPLVRVSGPRVVADLDELADRARRIDAGTAPGSPTGPAAGSEPAVLPDPTRLCCAVVRGAVEAVRGDRPVAQLARWVSPTVLEALTTRAGLVRGLPRPNRVPRPALVRRARVVRLGATAAEASVVVEDVDRVRAAALRVEAHRGQWRVVALEIG
ncbi:Rv3235 family protein [Luteimicrobium sp. NPDC057192]|uniref:Rv3235 family protein n=1 Tax=Luteimicrobium sp. NPDC057192 TaxID=3346042 RepID=UPI003643593F